MERETYERRITRSRNSLSEFFGCEFLHNQGAHLMKAILPVIESADRRGGKLILSRILQKLSRLPLVNRLG